MALDRLEDSAYLEIGVRSGAGFRHIRCPLKIGVDPVVPRRMIHLYAQGELKARLGRWKGQVFLRRTSNEFFEHFAHKSFERHPLGVVLVDGLHTQAQALQDVENALTLVNGSGRSGLVVMHDCSPLTSAKAAPSIEEARRTPGFSGGWNGDVYRAVIRLRIRHPDLFVGVLDTDQGVCVITRGPASSALQLSEDEAAVLSFEDLDANRKALLNLMPPSALEDVIAHIRA